MTLRILPTLIVSFALTGCGLLPRCEECENATWNWHDASTGEKAVIVGFCIVGVAALYAVYDSYKHSHPDLCYGPNCGTPGPPPENPNCPPGNPRYPLCN
jgi:hypothetical protein